MSRVKKSRPSVPAPRRQTENGQICKINQLSNKYSIIHPAERQPAEDHLMLSKKVLELLRQKLIFQRETLVTAGAREFTLATRLRNGPLSEDRGKAIHFATNWLERLKKRSERQE